MLYQVPQISHTFYLDPNLNSLEIMPLHGST